MVAVKAEEASTASGAHTEMGLEAPGGRLGWICSAGGKGHSATYCMQHTELLHWSSEAEGKMGMEPGKFGVQKDLAM